MSETQQRFQIRLRHLFLIVTVLCAFLALAVAIPFFAFLLGFVFVVGSAMARISTRSSELWIIGPIFALAGGFIGTVLSILFLIVARVFLTVEQTEPFEFRGALILPLFGVFFGGWYGRWWERKESGI